MLGVTPTGQPLAWTALQPGAPVLAVDGSEVGRVAEVVADEARDIFSGLVLRAGLLGEDRFVPAETVEEITDQGVRLSLSPSEVEKLGPPSA